MKKSCVPCHSNSPHLTTAQISKLLEEIPEYELIEADSMKRITKAYTFKDFKEALAFTNALALIAEEENHHPQINTGVG